MDPLDCKSLFQDGMWVWPSTIPASAFRTMCLRVFEPFFTTKEAGKGSGLGLAQVFGFAKQSGGGVGIETRVGEGTSVKVFLPRAEVALRDRERESVDAEPGPRTEMTVRILVVDDDGAVLRTTLRMLDALGYATVQPQVVGKRLR